MNQQQEEDQQEQLVISLDTQYAVARAIYRRFHANGHRKHLEWEDMCSPHMRG